MHHLARPAAALALAIGTVTALAACSSPDATATASHPAASAGSGGESGPVSEQTQAPADGGAQVPGTAQSGQSGQSGQDGLCATSDLKVTVKPGDTAAGSRYFTISFTNTSGAACRLNGHPGVSAVTGKSGKQIGKSAALGAPQPENVSLKAGKAAHAVIKAVNIGGDGGPLAGRCDVKSAAGFRVFPPDTRRSVFVEHKGLKACSSGVNWLTVGSVTK